jgi:hypothetical protein
MIDDLHTLRRKQRAMLIDELSELRAAMPVWLAERSIVLGDDLLSQGVREGREIREYSLEEMWGPGKQHQFAAFAENVLDRRLELQNLIPSGSFSQYLRTHFEPDELAGHIHHGIERVKPDLERYRSNIRYREWLEYADGQAAAMDLDGLRDLYVTRILLARDEAKKQLSLELTPLPTDELEERDSSQLGGAADVFLHEDLTIPYYFGIDRLCAMATSNVEELLTLGAALYEGLRAKHVLRKAVQLSPFEQEKLLLAAAKRRRDFIPKNHTAGGAAQRLLDAIGAFCREKTLLPTAPYAPGVTGIRLSSTELQRLRGNSALVDHFAALRHVLSECVAENLLVARASSSSTAREAGTIFYLNRSLCAYYALPLQMGGWQDVYVEDLIAWSQAGTANRQPRLDIH